MCGRWFRLTDFLLKVFVLFIAILAVINDKCFFTCCRICTPLYSTPSRSQRPVFVYLIGQKSKHEFQQEGIFHTYGCAKNWISSDHFPNIYLLGLAFIKLRFFLPVHCVSTKSDYYGVCKHRNREYALCLSYERFTSNKLSAFATFSSDRMMMLGAFFITNVTIRKFYLKAMRNRQIFSKLLIDR